jgi:Carboxypeptidase regulatory-like domain
MQQSLSSGELMKRLSSHVFLLWLMLFTAGAASFFAQGGATGAISGQVLDASGAAVPGAGITITGVGVRRALTADGSGSFTAPLLSPGDYHLTVSAPSFETATSDLQVRVTETTRFSIGLKPGAVTTEVPVNADIAAVETTNATTGQSITAATIIRLPLSTQNFQQLLTFSAGVTSSLNQNASLGRGDVRMDVNGQREDNNNYLIDGITATDYNVAELTNTPLPSPDAVQEFRVQTSMYDATQGRNGGGNINAVLKTGTPQIHGDAFEFFRNDVLNANEYFLKQQAQPRPVVKQNIFGGSVGGPLSRHGKLGYFFVNYQGTRQSSGLSNGTIIQTSLPVLPQDRSAESIVNAFFPGQRMSPSQIDPVALKLLNLKSNQFGSTPGGFLIPTVTGTPGGTGSFDVSRPGHFQDDQFTADYDGEFHNGSDKIAVRFFFTNFESNLPFGAGGLQASLGGSIARTDLNFPLDLPVHDRFLNVTETHIFSPRWVNEARFGYVRIQNQSINEPIATVGDLGIDRPNDNVDQLIYKFTFNSGGFQIGPTPGANQSQTQNNFIGLDTISYSHGPQLLRLGGEYDRVNLDKIFPQVFNGQLFFSPSGDYSDFQNFLLGAPGFSFGGSGVSNHQYRSNNISIFLQDDYKVAKNLTLNTGFRWELAGAFYDELYHIGNTHADLARAGQNPFVFPKGINRYNIVGITGTTSATTMDNSYASNYGPRFGFAYDVAGRGKTAIRGGYGIYYVKEDVGNVDQLSFIAPILPITFASGPPGTMATLFATGPGQLPKGGVIDPAFSPVFSQVTGFPDGDTTQAPNFSGNSVNLFGLEVPKHFVVPSTQQWNLTVQQNLGHGWIAELGYIGTKGTHLRETRDAIQAYDVRNHPLTITGAGGATYTITQNTAANVNARSRALGLGATGYQLFADDAISIYHSGQATLTHRLASGIEFQAAYTYSRALDETSTGNTAFNTAVNDQTNLKDSYGPSDFDRSHRLIFHYVYELPFFKTSHGVEHALLGGWTASGITTFQSGTPITVLDSGAASAFGLNGSGTPTTPDLVGQISHGVTHGGVHSRLTHYLNISNFAPAPAIGPDGSTGFGDLGRNTYRGPHQQNWDLSLAKNFAVTERHQLRFGADFFNLWNHAVFSSPSFVDVESAANFGAITSTQGSPRLIQFTGRYSF